VLNNQQQRKTKIHMVRHRQNMKCLEDKLEVLIYGNREELSSLTSVLRM